MAQIASSFAELRLMVRVGDTVSVVHAAGDQARGRILELSPTAMVLEVGGTRLDLREHEVTTIQQRRQDSLVNGALWGFGILGALSTMGYLVTTDGNPATALGVLVVNGGVGALVGAGLDALITTSQVIFRRPGSPAASVHVAPILERDRAGARVSWIF